MGNDIVETQLGEVKEFLGQTVTELESFLNTTTLDHLKAEEKTGNTEYYKQVLSMIRKLTVYSEEGLDACKIVVNARPFSKAAAEKTLYRIYTRCIEEFFSPKNDAWYEDSRAAYTGDNSIKFREIVPVGIEELMQSLEGEFQRMREELEYYETDYRTKMLQSR